MSKNWFLRLSFVWGSGGGWKWVVLEGKFYRGKFFCSIFYYFGVCRDVLRKCWFFYFFISLLLNCVYKLSDLSVGVLVKGSN